MDKKRLLIAIGFSLIMMMSAFAVIGNGQVGHAAASSGSSNLITQASNSQTPNGVAWQMPTTTMQEPGYTNGTFKMGIDGDVPTLNWYESDSTFSNYVLHEIYDSLYNELPSGVNVPWLATGFTVQHVTTNNKTYDIETNSEANYSYVYTVNLRPYVQWTDWSTVNASDTYTFSNYTCFHNATTGAKETHTYKSFSTTTMKTYYVQSADVVLSWRMGASLGEYTSVVNVIPDGNLSVKIFTTAKTLLIVPDVLGNVVLPYHIWVKHDFTSIPGLFNYTPSIKAGNGYYGWNLGWNPATGSAPGLVGTGPFMVTNNYEAPQGKVIPCNQAVLYVNPHYFVQYANASSGLRQYTPKFYEIYMPFYSSESGMVAAYVKGQIDTTPCAVPSVFEAQIAAAPGSNIYHKPSTSFTDYVINTAVAPLNVTAFRQALNYATPYSYIDSVIDGGEGYASSSPNINPHDLLYYNTSSPNYDFNMNKAKALINSIPGMVNDSGVLKYYGTPVSITIQSAPGSVGPSCIQDTVAISADWKALGIKVALKEEAITTLASNILGSRGYNFTTGTRSSNLYQMGVLEGTTLCGNPSFCLNENLNPKYGIPFRGYRGPFTNLTYNGKALTGVQVQDLFDNLTTKLVNTDNQAEAEKLTKEIQTLEVLEAFTINVGYKLDIVPELDTFTNYSHTNPESLPSYWYWQFFSIYENKNVVKVQQKYHLTVTAVLNNSTIETSGDHGSVTFTVYNGSKLVSGAKVGVAIAAPYEGIVNVSSTQLTANSLGQATFKYKVFNPLSKLLVGYNPTTGQSYIIHSEEVNITGYATVSNQPQTGPGDGQATVWLISHSLDISWTPNHGTFTAGEHGTIEFYVSYNGTAYADATVYISPVDLNNITYSSSDLKLTTNPAGNAYFNFTADKNINSTFDQSLVVNATPSSTSSVAASPNVTLQFELKPKKVTSNTLMYVEIGGAVAAAVVIIGIVTYVIRKPKVSGPKSGNSGSGTSGQ